MRVIQLDKTGKRTIDREGAVKLLREVQTEITRFESLRTAQAAVADRWHRH
jgi:hypothetical protein